MRKLFVFILLISVRHFAIAQVCTGYVSLEEKQFIDCNGDPFYPMLVNWGPAIIYEPVANTYHLSTYHSFGSGNAIECTTGTHCEQQILNEFNYIKGMGFNGIRLNGTYPIYDGITNELYFLAYDYTNPLNSIRLNVQMNDPYTDVNSTWFFDMYQKVLDIASQVPQPFYVIFNTWGVKNQQEIPPNSGNIITYDWETVIQPLYNQFLTSLGNRMQSHPNLLAYDFFNEPCYALLGTSEFSKELVCRLSGEWYNAVRVHDENHLTTIGNCLDDAAEFDPGIMKTDFTSPHFYPPTRTFNQVQTPVATYNAQAEGLLYWVSKNMPLPWIIGETGFTASSGLSWMDGVDGFLPEQKNFAELTANRTRDCNGSGYSWWNYQDVFHNDTGTPAYGGNFTGLLMRGITTCPDPISPCSLMEKTDIVDFFRDYTSINNAPPAPVPANCDPPLNYDDPFNHLALSTSQNFMVSGYVYDQYGNPIEDAVVGGWNFTHQLWNPNSFQWDNQYYYHYTFSAPNGYFQLVPYDYYGVVEYGNIEAMRISAVSAQLFCVNWWGTSANSINITQNLNQNLPVIHSPNSPLCLINKNYFGYDETVNNVTVPLIAPTPVNFKGWNKLALNNVILEGNGTSGATSDFSARKEVQVNTKFHAEKGSEVHLYTSDNIFPECVDYIGYRQSSVVSSTGSNLPADEKWIELTFKAQDQQIDFTLIPNPSKGQCLIKITGVNSLNGVLYLTEISGRNIFSQPVTSTTEELNLSFLSKGLYYIQLKTGNQIINKKIVLN